MRWIACLLTILLSGCYGVSLLERTTAEPPPPIMPLWESYQHCLAATDPTELFLIIEQFERVVAEGAEPPSWMKAWEAMWRTNRYVYRLILKLLEPPAPSGLLG